MVDNIKTFDSLDYSSKSKAAEDDSWALDKVNPFAAGKVRPRQKIFLPKDNI